MTASAPAPFTAHQAQYFAFAAADFGSNPVISAPDASGFVTISDPDTGYRVSVGATAADGFRYGA